MRYILDPRCKKCSGKIDVAPIYSSESYVILSCMMCGKAWDLDANGTGNGAIVAKFFQRQMQVVSNGVS